MGPGRSHNGVELDLVDQCVETLLDLFLGFTVALADLAHEAVAPSVCLLEVALWCKLHSRIPEARPSLSSSWAANLAFSPAASEVIQA